MKKIVFVLGVLFLNSVLNAQTITDVNVDKAFELIKSRNKVNSVIIDGRTAEMFQNGHIREAININAYQSTAADELLKYLNKEQIIVYCSNNNRSKNIIQILQKLNYKGEIVYVVDGINAWKTNGYEVINSAEELTELRNKQESNQNKLKPIVQVFGIAKYNLENNNYDYGLGRAHFGLSYNFDQKWSAKIIIDAGRPTSFDDITVKDSLGNPLEVINNSKEGSYYTMWLKFASLKYQINDKLSIKTGAILQNHYITQEKFWEYRYIAKTFQDMYWHIPSSDIGFLVKYKLNKYFAIDAALTNGEGPRLKQDEFGNVKFAAGLDFNIPEKFHSRIYYHSRNSNELNSDNEQMLSFFMGYKPTEKLRFGGEFNYMFSLNNFVNINSYGFSTFASYEILNDYKVFFRYDMLNYSNILNTLNSEYYQGGSKIISGFLYHANSSVNLSLNYQSWISNNNLGNDLNDIFFSMEYKF